MLKDITEVHGDGPAKVFLEAIESGGWDPGSDTKSANGRLVDVYPQQCTTCRLNEAEDFSVAKTKINEESWFELRRGNTREPGCLSGGRALSFCPTGYDRLGALTRFLARNGVAWSFLTQCPSAITCLRCSS